MLSLWFRQKFNRVRKLNRYLVVRFMTPSEWKYFAIGIVDGLERHLCPSAPKMARLQLAQLREYVSKARTAKTRKLWERRCDRLAESTPFFRGATRRHIGAQADIAIDGLEALMGTMIKLARVRGKRKAERGIAKILADFRKKRRKPIYRPIQSA